MGSDPIFAFLFELMETLTLEEVDKIRGRFAQAREIAAALFREAFAQQTHLPPNERWRAHLEIQAAAMLDVMEGVSLPPELRVAYLIDEQQQRTIYPIVIASDVDPPRIDDRARLDPTTALFPLFRVERNVPTLLEYWIFTSELMSSSAWSMTKLIANAADYNEALNRMVQPQLVKPLFVSYLPAGEFRQDGTAILEVTVYARADQERVERRELLLDRNQEFQFHGRDLIAEGRGGVHG